MTAAHACEGEYLAFLQRCTITSRHHSPRVISLTVTEREEEREKGIASAAKLTATQQNSMAGECKLTAVFEFLFSGRLCAVSPRSGPVSIGRMLKAAHLCVRLVHVLLYVMGKVVHSQIN